MRLPPSALQAGRHHHHPRTLQNRPYRCTKFAGERLSKEDETGDETAWGQETTLGVSVFVGLATRSAAGASWLEGSSMDSARNIVAAFMGTWAYRPDIVGVAAVLHSLFADGGGVWITRTCTWVRVAAVVRPSGTAEPVGERFLLREGAIVEATPHCSTGSCCPNVDGLFCALLGACPDVVQRELGERGKGRHGERQRWPNSSTADDGESREGSSH